MEISNEDALFTVWGRGQIDRLPEPYATTFRELWNEWLRKKYGDTEKLRKAWNVGEWPLGDEMLANGDFSQPLPGSWNLERDDQTEVQWSVEEEGPGGASCLRIVVGKQGRASWHPQINQSGLALKGDTPYTLTCYLRADKKGEIGLNAMMAHEPWERLGLSTSVPVGPEWREHRFTFVASQDDANARITVTSLEPDAYLQAIAYRTTKASVVLLRSAIAARVSRWPVASEPVRQSAVRR